MQNAMDALAGSPDPRITIDTGEADGFVWIRVSDNGPGIPLERRGELFSPFSSSKPLGLGLGLIISRDIASDLGGSLEFDPESEGAAFTVRIPAYKQ
jgi:two-component system C4-dicarboxylate transport sensor histidine kinase DctB